MQDSQIKQRSGNTKVNLFTGNIQGTRRHTKGEKKTKISNTWAEGVKVKHGL